MASQPGTLKHCRLGKENRLLSEVLITQAKDLIPGSHGLVRQESVLLAKSSMFQCSRLRIHPIPV